MFLSVGSPGGTCGPVDNQRNVSRCTIRPSVEGEVVHIAIAVAHPPLATPAPTPTPVPHTTLPAGLMAVPLTKGCNNVVLTYPNGSPIAELYHNAIPATAPGGDVSTRTPIVDAMWRYDNRTQRFLGWSPLPNAPNDLTTVNRLDAVFVCIREAGRLVQPSIP